MPEYTVTYPTLPNGIYTQEVKADSIEDAVRAARELDWPTNPGYTVEFDKEPAVWLLRYPRRIRSKRVSGPDYGG
ncbi:hypothetical protein OG875_04930 [Streptomyces sp. NBC_01498]|uniref:hypothetical protein n=1 Tax=Streptomyces sp. NBC_01498 TaxID=2975870 RepID=UPI002E7B7C9E|nr:hypothetical protein [Streptomyces sp. NBC_01498]WTL24001.1 hypothetical protein OG875_04930 [Streptomyces sp. NBC_01498]